MQRHESIELLLYYILLNAYAIYVLYRMELCHISDDQLRSRLRNTSDHLELIASTSGIYHLQPYCIYGTPFLRVFLFSDACDSCLV